MEGREFIGGEMRLVGDAFRERTDVCDAGAEDLDCVTIAPDR